MMDLTFRVIAVGRPVESKHKIEETKEKQMFDCQIQVARVDLIPGEDHIQIAAVMALGLPTGANQVMPLPAGLVRFALNKESAIKLGEDLTKLGADLPDEVQSDLVVAQSLAGVDEAIQQAAKFKTGK